MDLEAIRKAAVDQFRKSLRSPEKCQRIIDLLNKLPRKRGRPRRPRLPRGGSSRSQSDILIILSLEQGKHRVEEIYEHMGLPRSTVYRRLHHLAAQKLVTKQGRPQEWTLVGDRAKVDKYEFDRLLGQKLTRPSGLRDLKGRLEFEKYLAQAPDEVIVEFLSHHGDPDDFLRKQKLIRCYKRFIEVERKHRTTPYKIRRSEQRHYGQLERRVGS